MTAPNASTIAASTGIASVWSKMLIANRSTGNPDEPSSTRRIGSIPYDAGLSRVSTVIQPGRPTSGKSAPEREHRHHQEVHHDLESLHRAHERRERDAHRRQAEREHERQDEDRKSVV